MEEMTGACSNKSMRRKLIIAPFLIAAFIPESYGQNLSPSHGFWQQKSFSGEINLSGLYRQQKSNYEQMQENQQSTYYLGGIKLNSRSFLWGSDIADLNISGEYNPESRYEKYLQIPDRSEVRTLKNLDVRTTIFNNKPVTLNAFVGLNQTYYNREFLTNVRTNTNHWGGMMALNNKILPVTFSYRKSLWTQDELDTERTFKMDQEDLEGRISKSFGENDNNELIYAHNNYLYSYYGMSDIKNQIDRISLNDNVYFDRKKKYSINSYASVYDQNGSNEFRKIDVSERLILQFHQNLRFMGDYNFYRMEEIQTLNQNRVHASLNHRLYESLTSEIFGEYSTVNQTVYDESNIKAGLDLNYTKKIPTGRLNIDYRYYHHWFDVKSVPADIIVVDEEHQLSDTKITLLLKPYVRPGSVFVTDVTGIIVYQEGFDYNIIARDSYTEIQRIPGGLISDNQLVMVDYTASVPGTYGFEANNNTFSASLQFLNRLFELYYRGSWQHYSDLKDADFLVLNWYDQNVFGGQIDIGLATGGVEYDNYQSNIIPYKRMRYFLNLNWNIHSRVLLSVNGNIFDYKYISDGVNQKYSNISGKLTWTVTQRIRADFEMGYLQQVGKNIDLTLLTSRAEISASLRQLVFKAGADMYIRNYLNSDFSFFGTHLDIIRKF
jgi:hypothetical protein